MRKKFISVFLLGALTVASTSTLVSCKDYDDDINDLQTKIDNLESLKAVKADVESALNSLRAQLEAKDGELQAAINKNSTDIVDLQAAVASLEARIATAESALSSINTVLDGKVDKSEYDAKVVEIMGLVSAVSSDLAAKYASLTSEINALSAVDADLQQQINALDLLIKALQNSSADNTEILTKINDLKTELTNLINNKTSDVAGLKTQMQAMSDKVDAILNSINVLNVFVKNSLRGLVFVPDAYYWGIEATKMLFLENDNFDVASAAYNKKEAKGYTDHTRYTTSKYTKVLDFVASYHMNPSNADKNEFKSVTILDGDVDYINTRSSEAGLSVKDWNVAEGLLNVNINVSNPNKIKTVLGDAQVTNFATQVTIAKGDRDTTITSDYATLYTENIKDLVLCHKAGTDVPFLNVKNTHESECPVANHTDNGRLMQTAYEAHHDFEAQDYCFWNSTLDLRKLVETHYTTADGKHAVLDVAKYGMKYVFELTGLYYGDNETSESAHAAISPEDGYTFRPQMVAKDGSQQAYGAEQNRATTVGRTPLVRVSLVDIDDANVVYDYGYIRIKIADPTEVPTEQPDEFIDYTGAGWSYNYECTPKGWEFSTTWNVTEYDLYHKLGVTREEFEANYGAPVYKSGNSGALKQYIYNETTKKFAAATDAQYYGTVTTITDVTSSADGFKTSTLKWNITGADAKKYFVDNKMKQVVTSIKYESKDKVHYPDVYVMFKTGEPISIIKPTGDLTWDPIKNPKYWYASNTSNQGTDEIHNNVLTPEDNDGGKGDEMVQKFSAVMLGNNIDATKIITVSNDNTGEYATSKLSLDLIFSSKNNNKQYKGNDGNVYTITVGNNGKELKATLGLVTETIAKISSDTDVNDQTIEYVRTSTFAQELLNYAAHNKLADDVIKAIVTTTAVNGCPMPLELDNETFDVRFLRPINVFNANKVIEDANTSELQVIKLHEMVTFTDWRDAWKPATGLHGEYCTYYGITGIEVAGVSDGEYISTSEAVRTNQSGKWEPLKNVNSQLDFKYTAGTDHSDATLTYRNFSSTVQEFQVEIPVVVTYYWGKIRTTVTVTVQKTSANAKKH